MTMMDTNRLDRDLYWIHDEERKWSAKLDEAIKQRDRVATKKAHSTLVKLYVRYGEYFKMSSKPDPRVAEHYLKKAISLQKDHPVANYRLAHLKYRKEEYTSALAYFERAIEGSTSEGLNDSQELIANMFMANCGLVIARQALMEMDTLADKPNIHFDEALVGLYRPEMFEAIGNLLEIKFYRKITSDKEELITEDKVQLILDEKPSKQVLFCLIDDGMYVFYKGYQPIKLEQPSFNILYFLLKAEKLMTGEDLIECLYDGMREEIGPDVIRQSFSRLSRRIPYWDEIIQTEQILHHGTGRRRTARRRADGISYCIISRVGDLLPDEG
jgi:tetratricopeptide (TPR) repeat protein